MASIYEVEEALRDGDTALARQLLQELVQEHPSADAWFLAARITRNQEIRVKYLKRALALDPAHQKSRELLQELGGEYQGFFSSLLEEILPAGISVPANISANRWLRLGLFAMVSAVLIIGLGLAVLRLIGPGSQRTLPPPPTSAPLSGPPDAATYTQTFQDRLPDVVVAVEEADVAPPLQATTHLILTLHDINYSVVPADYQADLYLYPDDPQGERILADLAALRTSLPADRQLVNRRDAIFVYPTDTTQALQEGLVSLFLNDIQDPDVIVLRAAPATPAEATEPASSE